MALTLRGMLESTWNVFKYVNPITAPYFIGKAIFENKTVRDSVQVAADTTVAAAKNVKKATDVVLDYPIDEGARKAYDATARGVKTAVETTEQAIDTGVRAVQTGVNNTVEAIDEAQEDARRGVADWISPDDAPAAPAVPAPAAPSAPARAAVPVPTTPTEIRAFQVKFNSWLASEEGKAARESGVAPLKVDGIVGPMTKYAVALYNMG